MNNEKTEQVQNADNSASQAKAQLESVRELVGALKDAEAYEVKHPGRDYPTEKAREAITQDPLSVEVRSGWYGVNGGSESGQKPEEFKILLCTGGPAVQILGKLSEHGEPESCTLQHQDWGTPWTDYPLTAEDEETLLEYCRQFYFGE